MTSYFLSGVVPVPAVPAEWDGTFGPSVTVTGNVTICRGPRRGHVETFLGVPRGDGPSD